MEEEKPVQNSQSGSTNPAENALVEEALKQYKKFEVGSEAQKDKGIEILDLLFTISDYQRFLDLFKPFNWIHTIPEAQWTAWLQLLLSKTHKTHTDQEASKKVLQIFSTALDSGYYPQLSVHIIQLITLMITEAKTIDYQFGKGFIEEIINHYGYDYHYSPRIFDAYEILIKAKSDLDDRRKEFALKSIRKRRVKYIFEGFVDYFEDNLKALPVSVLKRVEEQKGRIEELKDAIEFIQLVEKNRGGQEIDHGSKISPRQVIEFLSALAIQKVDSGFIIFCFETCRGLKCFENDPKARSSLWQNIIGFINKEVLYFGRELLGKYLARAAKENIQNLDFSVKYIDISTESLPTINQLLEEFETRLGASQQLVLFKIWTYLFQASLRRYVINLKDEQAKINNEEPSPTPGEPENYEKVADEAREHSKSLAQTLTKKIEDYLNKKGAFSGPKGKRINQKIYTKSLYQAKSTHTTIYKDLIKFLVKCGFSEKEKSFIEQSLEKLVKHGGNDPKNWIFYLESLSKKGIFGDLNKMKKIFKRSINFCSGDIFRIFVYFDEFFSIYGEQFFEDRLTLRDFFWDWLRKGAAGTGSRRSDFDTLLSQMQYFREHNQRASKKIAELLETDQTLNQAGDQGLKEKNQQNGSLYENEEKAKKTLFVKNLRLGIKEEEILDMLTITSTIEDIRIINRKTKHNESSTAYIDFNSPQAVLEAKKELNKKIYFGRKLYAEVSKPPAADENKNTLFVRNVPYEITEDEFIDEVNLDRALVLQVRMKRGFCYVKFRDEESMNKYRVGLIGFLLRGRKLEVKLAVSSRKRAEIEAAGDDSVRDFVKKRLKVGENQGADKDDDAAFGGGSQMDRKNKNKKKKKRRSNKDMRALFGL